MSKKGNVSTQPRPVKFRFLSILLTFVIVVSMTIQGICMYDIFAKSANLKSGKVKAKGVTEEQERIKEERQNYENKKKERQKKGNISYVSNFKKNDKKIVVDDYSDAQEALIELQSELGVSGGVQDFKFDEKIEKDNGDQYKFKQYYDGYPVDGYGITMDVNDKGEIESINGNNADITDFDTDSEYDLYDLSDDVEDYIKSEYGISSSDINVRDIEKKIIMLNNETPVMANIYDVYMGYDYFMTRVALDASTKDVISDDNLLLSDMMVFDSDDPASPNHKLEGQKQPQKVELYSSWGDYYYFEDNEREINVYTASENGAVDRDNGYNVISYDSKTETPNKSGVDAMANAQKAYDFYKNILGREGLTSNRYDELRIIVNLKSFAGNNVENNAFFSGTEMMFFGAKTDGSPEASYDADVVAHEYTHGIINNTTTLTKGYYDNAERHYKSEQYAIAEGIADIMAEFAQDYSDDGTMNNSCDWKFGDGGIRDLADPSKSTEAGTHLTDVADFVEGTTESHLASTILSHTAYLMTIGADGSDDKKITDTGILANLWYETMLELNSGSSFEDVRKIFENKAIMAMDDKKLTMKQFEGIMDSFDRAGIGTLYVDTMTPKGEITVYDFENKGQEEYNITITDFSGKEVVNEDVTSPAYQADLEPGIYMVSIMDKAGSGRIGKQYVMAVNDNDPEAKVEEYPEKTNVYSNFGSTAREVSLVLDVSGSMSGTPLEETKKAASNFVETVLDQSPNTFINLITYESDARLVVKSSNDKSELQGAIANLNDLGGTNMYAGLEIGEQCLEESECEKKLLIIMSDGIPCVGEEENGDYGKPIVRLATDIKAKGTIIYSLGFFHNLYGEELAYGKELMEDVASEGCSFNVQKSEEVQFVFDDIAQEVSGNSFVIIRIACPVDVNITRNGESLCSSSSNLNTRASFGSLSFEGKDNEVKVVRLFDKADYEVCINGIGKGTMDYSISYADADGEYTDKRSFKKIPITTDTVVVTNTDAKKKTVLDVDTDGDGIFDTKYVGGSGKNGKKEKDYSFIIYIILAAVSVIGLTVIGIVNAVKTHKFKKEHPEIILERQGVLNIVTKFAFMVVFAMFTWVAVLLAQSAASTVFTQISNQRYVSAELIYNKKVDDTVLNKAFLSMATDGYLDRINKAYESGKIDINQAESMYKCVKDMKMGKASDTAKEYLKKLGGDKQEITTETETTEKEDSEAAEESEEETDEE